MTTTSTKNKTAFVYYDERIKELEALLKIEEGKLAHARSELDFRIGRVEKIKTHIRVVNQMKDNPLL